MAWHKKPSGQIDKPTPPPYLKWLLFFLAAMIVSTYLLLTLEQKELKINKLLSILIIISPVILVLITLSTKLFIYIKNYRLYAFLEREKQYIDNQWCLWGERSVSVLDSCLLLPEKTTLPYILNHTQSHVSSYNITQKIDYLPNHHGACFYLLRSVKDIILTLPPSLPLHITYVTDKSNDDIAKKFRDSWVNLLKNKQYANISIISDFSFNNVDKIISKNDEIINIIIFEQNEIKNIQSELMAIFILTSDDVTKKYQLSKKIDLKRPMSIDANDDIKNSIKIFGEVQVDSINSVFLFSAGKINDQILAELYQSDNCFGYLSPQNMIDLEFFSGPTGKYAPWFIAALASQYVEQKRKPTVILSTENDVTFISTITPVMKNEI
ncbi:hypothetical protein [Providencia heimbachae]|uniref:Type VI secretion protein n=2 Tax=Providencia heimbachae TaxID=333962 RepID=A0A1B7K3K7_9GAMM|nr:hypothetical protein [Providencia heimbachae]OAT54703.1 hypothetical protein M998_0247 [Providencia heimbachae ATCC 35613]SQH13305.1 Uncharacterised protein [Providencia heimbachae]